MQSPDDQALEMLRQQTGNVQPSTLPAQFSIEAIQDLEASEKQGKPVFKDEEFITIWIPGDKDNVIHRPVRPVDKVMYPDKYKAFKNDQAQVEPGIPLERMGGLSKAQIAELNYYSVKTVEQLATMPDSSGQRVMGFQSMKQKAKAYLDAIAGAAPAQRLQSELSKRDEEISMLKEIVSEQTKKLDELSKRKA